MPSCRNGNRLAHNVAKRWPVIAFTLMYMTCATITSLVVKNLEFVFYLAVMIALTAIVAAIDRRVGLTTAALWALSVWGGLHMAGGLVPVPPYWPTGGQTLVLYSLWLVPGWLKYDHVIHAYGFGVTTWVCWQLLDRGMAAAGQRLEPTFGVMVLCAAAGMGFGAINEVIEFFATLVLPATNVGGYHNTGWDLVANTVGAICVASLIWIRNQVS